MASGVRLASTLLWRATVGRIRFSGIRMRKSLVAKATPACGVSPTVIDVRYNHHRYRHRFASTISELPETCWQCGKSISGAIDDRRHDGLICGNCGAIKKLDDDINYFVLFGLSVDFELDPVELTSKFRQLQSLVHPDKFAGKSTFEQELSSTCSSLLNTAYQTLLNPVNRGLYLLSMENHQIAESDLEVDGEFLIEIMELNERLTEDEINLSDDQLQVIRTDLRKIIDELLTVLASSFRHEDLHVTKRTLGKLKYYNNIDIKIKSLEMARGVTH